MGTWTAVGYYAAGAPVAMSSVSYQIPLEEPSEKVVYLNKTETQNSTTNPVEGCELELGEPAAIPVAPPGTLCVFTREEEGGKFKYVGIGESGDTPAGAPLFIEPDEVEGLIGVVNMNGTWAVTAK